MHHKCSILCPFILNIYRFNVITIQKVQQIIESTIVKEKACCNKITEHCFQLIITHCKCLGGRQMLVGYN